MSILHLTEENFETEVMKDQQTVLVDFWAAWCGPCQMLTPILESVADEVSDVKICKVNVDEQPELARRFRIMSIPTLLVFRNGELAETVVGVQSKDEIMGMIS